MQNNMSFNNNPSDSEIQYIKDELKLFNDRIVGDDNHKQINIIVKNDRDEIIGGLISGTYWEWLYIDRLWVHENYRNQGIGKSILKLAEDEAKRRSGVMEGACNLDIERCPDNGRMIGAHHE